MTEKFVNLYQKVILVEIIIDLLNYKVAILLLYYCSKKILIFYRKFLFIHSFYVLSELLNKMLLHIIHSLNIDVIIKMDFFPIEFIT